MQKILKQRHHVILLPQRRWRPYPPEVTQQLERAYSKNLRSVFLGDSDPSLKNYCIHLPQMEQECISTGQLCVCTEFKWLKFISELIFKEESFRSFSLYSYFAGDRIKVRRSFFPQSSPAGQGAVWQWAGDAPGDWHTYDMCVQCIIEESWGTVSKIIL